MLSFHHFFWSDADSAVLLPPISLRRRSSFSLVIFMSSWLMTPSWSASSSLAHWRSFRLRNHLSKKKWKYGGLFIMYYICVRISYLYYLFLTDNQPTTQRNKSIGSKRRFSHLPIILHYFHIILNIFYAYTLCFYESFYLTFYNNCKKEIFFNRIAALFN